MVVITGHEHVFFSIFTIKINRAVLYRRLKQSQVLKLNAKLSTVGEKGERPE